MINDWELLKRIPACQDIDECDNKDTCPENSICQNSAGNYTCQCNTGFGGDLCQDIDECSPISSCAANATCSNNFGSYQCSCNIGFYGDGKTCKAGQCDDRRCPSEQKCISPTSNQCTCAEGLIYDEQTKICADVDECLLENECDENSACTNSKGSYSCSCRPGYFGDGKTCEVQGGSKTF